MKRLLISVAVVLAIALTPAAFSQQLNQPMNVLDHPRYKENPVYLFFENYILDIVGELPPEKSRIIQGMNIQKVFNTKSAEWHEALREALDLSNTIDVAILDLWYRNQEIANSQGVMYSAQHFAMNFTDEYMKDESRVDVWLPGALDAAKERIASHRSKNAIR
jgi:hypothetical protein